MYQGNDRALLSVWQQYEGDVYKRQTIPLAVFAIPFCIEVDDHRRIHVDFISLYTILHQEVSDGSRGGIDFLIEFRPVSYTHLPSGHPSHRGALYNVMTDT